MKLTSSNGIKVKIGSIVQSVESNWIGRVVEIDPDDNLLKCIGAPSALELSLDQTDFNLDDIQYFYAEDVTFLHRWHDDNVKRLQSRLK